MGRGSGERRRSTVVILAALLVAAAFVPAASAATGAASSSSGVALQQDGDSVNTTTVSSPDHTYESLSRTAAHPNGAPPSIRPSGSYAEYAIKHLPTGLFYFDGFEQYAGRGTKIERTSFEFWSKRPYQTASNPIPDKTVTLHTVIWKKKTVTVTENNQTRQEPIATNITETKHTLTLGPGYTTHDIELPKKWDSSYRLTVFVASESDTARWQYTYNPSKTAKVVPAQSSGARTLYIAALFGVAALAAGVSLKGSRGLLKKAGAGPDISLLVWGLLVVPGAFVVFFVLGWDWTIQQLVTAPWLFPIMLGCVVGFMATVWFGDYTFTDLFVRLKLDDNIPDYAPMDVPNETAPTGRGVVDVEVREISTLTDGGVTATGKAGQMQAVVDSFKQSMSSGGASSRSERYERTPGTTQELSLADIPGVISADVVPRKMTRYEDGSIGPIRSGISAFLARAKGAATKLKTDGNPHNRIGVDKGPYENLYFVDPEYEQVIDHKPESWTFNFPKLLEKRVDEDDVASWVVNWKAVIGGPLALATGWVFGSLTLDNGPLGAVLIALALTWMYVVEPRESWAYTELSPIHYDRVVEVVMSHASALSEVSSLEDSWNGWVNSETKRRAERRRLADAKSKTQSEAINEEFLASESNEEEDFNADSRSRDVHQDDGRGGRR
ncbi:hypothetical protein [Halobaculum marinum]|uniref:DUF2207 domain-containing protein n=1 Tax=Halobaculum marinum TaxID=3031996 RepID=A0ABD5WUT3_9EURY|nr:hypothetical protein [Halobaculum sp. DT55]